MSARRLRLRSLRLHPAAEAVPEMSEREYQALRDDIAKQGILTPLDVTAANVVLDGRHRLQAARELEHTTIPCRVVTADDETGYVWRAALLRRHLSPSQAGALAVELDEHEARLEHGRQRKRANLKNSSVDVATLPHRGERSRELIAKSAGVSARTVQDVLTVRDHNPELFEQVKRGEIPAHKAAQQVRRAQRYAAIGKAGKLPSGTFDLVYADPPWQLGNPSSEYAPENYYPTLPLDEIKAMRVPAARDAVLFLWSVNGLLPEALEVMAAWGFDYRANISWDKLSIGQGVWTRSQHELLLIGRRGNQPPPAPTGRVSSVLQVKRGRHSEKPAEMYALIEQMYPRTRKLELFARGTPRKGWTAWGNEVEAAA